MLAFVVTHTSQSKVVPAALLELRVVYELFESAAVYGGRAVKFIVGVVLWFLVISTDEFYSQLSIIFKRKSNKSSNSEVAPNILNVIFQSTPPEDEPKEEKLTPPLPTPPNPALLARGLALASAHTQLSGSRSASTSSPQSLPGSPDCSQTTPHLRGAPDLSRRANVFDGHIAAQIQDAYLVIYLRRRWRIRGRVGSRSRRGRDRDRGRGRGGKTAGAAEASVGGGSASPDGVAAEGE